MESHQRSEVEALRNRNEGRLTRARRIGEAPAVATVRSASSLERLVRSWDLQGSARLRRRSG
jgi:hypothetical protein